MDQQFLSTVFSLIEHINRQELRNSSKHLIINYIKESGEIALVDRGREAVERYTNTMLPSLDRLKEKDRVSRLEPLDHLVLKLAYSAKQAEERR